jgi:hypothetical protein
MGGDSSGLDNSQPHSPQNLNLGGFGELQLGQIISNLAPHLPQNFMSSGFSNWHSGHCIFVSFFIKI